MFVIIVFCDGIDSRELVCFESDGNVLSHQFFTDDNIWKRPGFFEENLDYMSFHQWYDAWSIAGETMNPPYLIGFNAFLTQWECKYLIDMAQYDIGWDKVNETSKNLGYDSIICSGECEQDVIIKSILKRVEWITGIPNVNAEDLEFRRYKQGVGHKPLGHDYKEEERNQPQGVRVSTFYIHLMTEFQPHTSAAWRCPYMGVTARYELSSCVAERERERERECFARL